MAEWNGQGYERISALQQAMASEVLSTIHLEGSERILDVGCGSGRITAALAVELSRGQVVGVDVSSDMIAFAESARERDKLSNLSYQVGDARQMPFVSEFDGVVSFNALHWIPDQADALDAIYRALRPAGWARLRLVSKGARTSLEDTLEAVRRSPPWASHFTDFRDPYLRTTPEQYEQLVERSGFRVISMEVTDKVWDFQSREHFRRFGQVTFVNWSERIPEQERPMFIEHVLNEYQKVTSGGPGQEQCFRFYQMDLELLRA